MSNACVACGANDVRPLFRTRDRHYGIAGEFDLVRCAHCGLIRLDPMPSASELAGFYAKDYYAYVPQKRSRPWKARLIHLLGLEIKTHDPAFARTGDFLDIGCGRGDYVQIMAQRGWKARGVEPSCDGALSGRNAGLDIFHGTLLDASYPAASFDYIRSNHSFEHVPNPIEVLQEVHRILRPGGRCFIGVPNADSIPFRLFGRYWWYLGVPVHTFNYSAKTLRLLLERSGFEVERVIYNSNFWSLLGSLQIYMNRDTGKQSEEGWLARSFILRVIANVAEKCVDRIGQGDAIEVIFKKSSGTI